MCLKGSYFLFNFLCPRQLLFFYVPLVIYLEGREGKLRIVGGQIRLNT